MIYIIYSIDDCTKQVPAEFVMMSGRSEEDYRAVFSAQEYLMVNKIIYFNLNYIYPHIRVIHVSRFCLDFEAATWQAIRHEFPMKEYMWRQWLNNSLFSLDNITIYGLNTRTNNNSEGYNSRLNKREIQSYIGTTIYNIMYNIYILYS